MNSLFLDALRGKPCERPPIWLMRQAGRYLPEYQSLRKRYSFLELCHNPELAAEVTQLPLRRFGFDAAILFSDILIIAEALGADLRFLDATGPHIENPLSTSADIHRLKKPDVSEDLDFVSKEIHLLKSQLTVPLIGFCGAPFTIASYLIEGKTSKNFAKTKKWMVKDPTSFHQLLEIISNCTIDYLNLQIDAGVDAIQIFDSWANALSYDQFQEFSSAYLKKIMSKIQHRDIPVILFCKGTAGFIPASVDLKPSAISVDWACDITHIRQIVPDSIALQGNLDPHILFASHEDIQKATHKILKGMKSQSNYIFNLGHGVLPDTPLDAVQVLVDSVKNHI